jgi:serine/threonine-protein kinase
VAHDHHEKPELQAGDAIGPYDLIAPIGAGGMARVWAARVRGKSDIVAVKMLLPELAENVELRKMFFDEARIASRVRHANVCSTFAMGDQAGTLYLAMEWLDGPSLMRILRPGREDTSECARIPIRPRIAARIVADACAGLHAAHELVGDDGRPLAVVHRDVSPHNLLVTSTGEVKITDFGVAKALGKSHMTMAGQLKGKLAYMAPEQLVGGTVDRRCDVFALGCVLYEITTGQRPFQGEHDPQVMTSIMLGRYEPPSTIAKSYPQQLSIIVVRALANEPKNRFASAEEMRRALEAYLQTSGPQIGPTQLAGLVTERCGPEMAARAAVLRGGPATGGTVTSGARAPAHSTGSFASRNGAMMLERPAASSRRPLLWMGAAATIGACLGVGVLSYVRATRKPHPQPATSSTAAPPPGTAFGSAAPPSSGSPPDSLATARVATSATGQGRVHLRISPIGAVVIVDGVVLPRGTDTIAKPVDGATINVLVRADKHEDTIVLVDTATPDDVEVRLIPRTTTWSAGTSGRPRNGTKDKETETDAGDSSGTGVVDAPPNPYD